MRDQPPQTPINILRANHYIVKNGSLTARTDRPQKCVNYRWIPTSQLNKPTSEDYYRQTVRRLQQEVKHLMDVLKKKEEEWTHKFQQAAQRDPNFSTQEQRIRRQWEQKFKKVEDEFKLKERQLWKKQSLIRGEYEGKLNTYSQQIRSKQGEIYKKEGQLNNERNTYQNNIKCVTEQLKDKERRLKQSENQLVGIRQQYQQKVREIANYRHATAHESSQFYQTQLSDVTQKLHEKQNELSNRQSQIELYRAKLHQQLQQTQQKLTQAEFYIQCQENELKNKEIELQKKQDQLQTKNQEIQKKDKLIEYQLGVVERLIGQIEEKERQQEAQNNYQQQDDDFVCQNNHKTRFGSERNFPIQTNPDCRTKIKYVKSYCHSPEKFCQSKQYNIPDELQKNHKSIIIQSHPQQQSILPFSLAQNVPYSLGQPYAQAKQIIQRQGNNRSVSTGDILDSQIQQELNSVEIKSRNSEEILSENLKTWAQWASKTSGPSFFADLLDDQKIISKKQKTSQDEEDPATGGLNSILGRFSGML